MLQKILQKMLAGFSRKAIRKYKPIIIGITGSVGKSSTKEAIYAVLKKYFVVRRSLANYNNEIGLPLTILGRLSPGKSLAGWLRVFWMGIGTICFPERSYPKILVLEMAADHPGDIEYLINIALPQIGVITAIGPSHLKFFKNVENVARDKQMLIKKLSPRGWAILNADDERVMAAREKTEAKVLTFGISHEADVRALEIDLDQKIEDGELKIKGLKFKVSYMGSAVPVFLPNILARSQIYSVLAGIACGVALNLNLIEIAEALRDYEPLPGRMRPIRGIRKSLIIDDSYNSSPRAAEAALATLAELKKPPSSKKWAVLGDMLELGADSREEHLALGRKAVETGIDYLITVGKETEAAVESAKRKGFDKDKIEIFNDAAKAGEFLRDRIQEGDIILVKGSRATHLEKTVKKIMASHNLADRLLVSY